MKSSGPGRGFQPAAEKPTKPAPHQTPPSAARFHQEDLVLISETQAPAPPPQPHANLKKLADVPHDYRVVRDAAERQLLLKTLQATASFGFALQTTGPDAKQAALTGLAFSLAPHTGFLVPLQPDAGVSDKVLEEFRAVLESDRNEKTGHNLKFCASVLQWHGVCLGGKLFDCMIAHSLIEPDVRHTLEYLAESYLGHTPLHEPEGNLNSEAATEAADLAVQLRAILEPLLKEKGQEQVFYEIESPLIPVLVEMEHEGIKVDARALADFGAQLSKEIDE